MRSRRAIIAAVVVVAVAIGGIWWWRLAPEGFLATLDAVDDGTAVVVWRRNTNDSATEWVTHFDRDGALDWRHELSGLTTGHAVHVIGDLVTVRYEHSARFGALDQCVAAFALSDGHVVWDRVLISGARQADMVPFTQAVSAGGKLIEQVVETDYSRSLYVIDPASGEIMGHTKIATRQEPYGALAIGDRLVLHDSSSTIHFVDPSRVAVTDVKLDDLLSGCIVGDDYIAIDQGALVAFHRGDPTARRVIADNFGPARSYVLSCGHYRDRLVFQLASDGKSPLSIALADPNGVVLATLAMPFGPGWTESSWLTNSPDVLQFSGALPRFAAFLTAENNPRLAMIDLEQAKIAWVEPKPYSLADEVFHVGDRWYLNNSVTGGKLIAFDGATGKSVAAVDGGAALEPTAIGGGKLWLHGKGWSRLDRAPLAVLDAKTLAVEFSRGLDVVPTSP